jgi:3-deoxy-manno-octulosonate cytidylyltransferase (CMP-KDO synthetase)
VADTLRDSGADMATLATRLGEAADLFDPDIVKLVRAGNGDALYFSRAPIPWPRDAFRQQREVLPPGDAWLRHIGIYAYRAGFLRRFTALPPGRLEQLESLEQLRALEAGFRIAVGLAPEPFPPGIDTPADLERAERLLAG